MLSSLIPTRDWNPEMAAIFSRYLHYYSWANATYLSEDVRRTLIEITAGLVLVSGGVTIVRVKDPAIRGLVGFSVISVLVTLATTGMYFRYMLSAEMCVALVLATLLVRHFRTVAATLWLPSILLLVALLAEFHRPGTPLATELRVATNMTTIDQEYASDPNWNMWRYINEHTTSDARVLVGAFYTTFGASNYGCFWLDVRCFTTDSYIQSFVRLSDWQSFARSLNRSGIRYLLIADQQFTPGRIGFSFVAEANEYPFCRQLADRYGKKLAQFGSLQFYSFGPVPEAL
jgi:hypothetical protein